MAAGLESGYKKCSRFSGTPCLHRPKRWIRCYNDYDRDRSTVQMIRGEQERTRGTQKREATEPLPGAARMDLGEAEGSSGAGLIALRALSS